MTSIPNNDFSAPRVHYDEPAVKPPPLLAVGPVAWLRNNLFKSAFDTVLTVVFSILAVAIVVGIVLWSINSANWFVITKNLRQFMVGRFPIDQLWRVEWMVLFYMFIVGFSVATWARVSRILMIILVALLALMFILPPVINATTAPPMTYLAVGNNAIQSGTVTETPLSEVAFIGAAGEAIAIRVADEMVSDETLATLSGFADRSTNAVLNATLNRFAVGDEIALMQEQLAGDALTDAQRADLEKQLADAQLPPSVVETFAVNEPRVEVEVLDGLTLEVLSSDTLTRGEGVLNMTLPHDGWYILRKTTDAEEGVTLLDVQNIAPHMTTEFSANNILYRRMSDTFEIGVPRPKIDGKDVPMMMVIDHQFTGARTFSEFMRLYVSPFFAQINFPLLLIGIANVVGYYAARLLDRVQRSRGEARPLRRWSSRTVTWLWMSAPIVTAILIAGTDTTRWGGLLLTFMLTAVGILASFPIGVLLALGRRSALPIVKLTSILIIEVVRGVPLISVLFIANLMLPLLNPALVSVPGVIRAMAGITIFSAAYLAENVRGGLQSIPEGQEEAGKALGLSGWQVTLFITLPQALRAVIPALVGQAIALFKDTSLVTIVGLFDLTKIADSSIAQSEFIGSRAETYLFISIIYFLFSYVMGYVSRKIEESGSGAARRA